MIDQHVPVTKERPSANFDTIMSSADIRSKFIPIGRAIIALGQLIFLVFTSEQARFAEVGSQVVGPRCQGWSQGSVYCLIGTEKAVLADALVGLGLILVISGLYPRWTGLLHLYLTYAISTTLPLSDNGKSAVLVFVAVLALVSFSDERRLAYTTDLTTDYIGKPIGRISQTAILFGRIYLCLLYAAAAISQLGGGLWADDAASQQSATHTFLGEWLQALGTPWSFAQDWPLALALWVPVALEVLIAVNILGTANMRRAAFTFVVILHAGTALSTGSVSFGLIMIGCCLAVVTPPNRYEEISLLSKPADSTYLDDFVPVKADIRPHPFVSFFRFHQAFTRPVVCCAGVATEGRWGGDLALVKIGEPVAIRMRYKLTRTLLGDSPEVVLSDKSEKIYARLGLRNGAPFKVKVIEDRSSAARSV